MREAVKEVHTAISAGDILWVKFAYSGLDQDLDSMLALTLLARVNGHTHASSLPALDHSSSQCSHVTTISTSCVLFLYNQ